LIYRNAAQLSPSTLYYVDIGRARSLLLTVTRGPNDIHHPDTCHHPKEDVIFERLVARDAAAAASIGDLETEHREGAKRLRLVAETVEAVLNDKDLPHSTVSDIIYDFMECEREHMMMEERTVFPAALKVLRPADWAEIALKLADREDPLSQPGLEQKFNTLRRKILELEEEAEAARRSNE